MSQIKTREVRYRYRGRPEWALSGVTLDVNAGEFILLLGPSGSGKSTLARCFNGLIPHSVPGELTGTIEVCGFDVTETPTAELAERVGLVFQNPCSQFVTSTVNTEVAFGLENLCMPPAEMSDRITDVLDEVGLSGFETRQIDTLSGGEKQRLAIACQLAMDPEILVLDEPTANLDPRGTESVYGLLRELARDDSRTIVLIEHQCESLIEAVDRTLVLDGDGSLLLEGTPKAVFGENPQLLRREGVWIPEITQLALELRSSEGWPSSTSLPVTVDQAVDGVGDIVAKRRAEWTGSDSQSSDAGGRPEGCVDQSNRGVVRADGATEPEVSEGATMSPALEIRGLDARYGTPKVSEPVLRGVELSVPDGSFLALVGPNGAGKSTLASHCVGVRSPPSGTVFVNGRDLTTLSSHEISQHVGYVFQNPESQFITESVQDELAYGLRQLDFDTEEIEQRVEQTLERFDLTGYAERNPFTLSHGEKRRLSVATMLVVGQDVLIVDEPTYGQDRANADALMERLSKLHDAGRTVVMLTHDMRIVAEHADAVAVLVDGKIQFHGTPADLFADPETLSAAHLSQPPLAELAEGLSGFSGPATLDRCYEYCTGGRTKPATCNHNVSSERTLDCGEER